MSKKSRKSNLDKDINDLKDWQDHQYDPGHYIGTGRIPRPLSNLGQRTFFMMVLGSIQLILAILILVTSKEISVAVIFMLLLAVLFLYRGIYNMIHNTRQRKNKSR